MRNQIIALKFQYRDYIPLNICAQEVILMIINTLGTLNHIQNKYLPHKNVVNHIKQLISCE